MSSISTNLKVTNVSGNTGGFGAVADFAYEQGGGIDIVPSTFSAEITEMASMCVAGATVVMTIASQDEPTWETVNAWLMKNNAALEITSQLNPPPFEKSGEIEYTATITRDGQPPLVGKAWGSLLLAFAEAIKGA